MKATILKMNDGYMVTGIDNDGYTCLRDFAGKRYASEKSALTALKRKGFEYEKATRWITVTV